MKNEEDPVMFPNATPPWPEWTLEFEETSYIENERDIAEGSLESIQSGVEEFRYRDYPKVIDIDREPPREIGVEEIEWRRVHEIFPHELYQVIIIILIFAKIILIAL